jgi:hypothetical protein
MTQRNTLDRNQTAPSPDKARPRLGRVTDAGNLSEPTHDERTWWPQPYRRTSAWRCRRIQLRDGRPQEHAVIRVDPTALRMFTGDYIFGGLFKFKVTEKSGKLYVQYPVFGDEPIELLPESQTRFFTTRTRRSRTFSRQRAIAEVPA